MAAADPDGGRFQIVGEIARGGMGRVVEAVDRQLGRTVALKQALDADPEARGRFAREVEITARLEHPSIVPVYDAGVSADGEPFYVMRKVTGAPLDRLLAAATSLDERLGLLPNLLAVADAVAHAHGRGIIHRDLKPANVLVGELGETVVIDWGLAKIVGEAEPSATAREPAVAAPPLATVVGTVVGTPGFMAPEQVGAGATDARTDVYALGACLYAVLAGRPPLAGVPETQVLTRTVDGSVPPLTDVVAGVPPDLVTIVEKAMARDPARRYLDAGGLSEDLRRFLTGQLVASHRYGAGQRLVRWLERNRALVAVSLAALAVLVVIAVIAIGRIVAAGERTLAALARERDRADELIVAQAVGLVDSDPTMAIAILQGLRPDSPYWRRLGATVAGARARGVAVGYPAHGPGTVRVSFAPDPADARVLTTGGGVIRLHDLARRTSRVLAEGSTLFAEWVGPLVVISGRPLAHSPYFLDPVTGAEAPLPWPREVATYRAGGGVLVFVDRDGVVAALDASGGLPFAAEPVVVPLELAATWVWASPSGTYLLAGNPKRMVLLARAGTALAWTPVRDLPADIHSYRWTPDETRLVVCNATEVIELDLAHGSERRWPDQYMSELDYADGRLFGVSMPTSDFRRLDPDGEVPSLVRYDVTEGQSLASTGDIAALLVDPRTIELRRGGLRHTVRPPIDVTQIAAQPGGRYLIGINAASMVAWDLTEVLPDHVEVPHAGKFGFIDGSTVGAIGDPQGGTMSRPIYRYAIGDAPFRIDAERLGELSVMLEPWFAPDGVVLGVSPDRSVIRAVIPSLPPTITDLSELIVTTSGAALAGTPTGAVYEVTPTTERVIATLPGKIVGLAERGGWIAAQLDDGTLWRRAPDGATATAQMPAYAGVAITATGEVYVGSLDQKLTAWPLTGPPAAVAALTSPVLAVVVITGDRVGVVTEDGVLHRYDPATRELRPVLPAAEAVTFSRDRTRAAGLIQRGIVVAELASGERWTVLDQVDLGSGWLALSPDGRTLLAGETVADRPPRIDRFRLDTPGDLRAWVLGATNASRPALLRGPVEWTPVPAVP